MPQSIGYHADLIVEAYRQRRTISAIREALTELEQNPSRHAEVMSRLTSVSEDDVPTASVPMKTVMLESLERINSAGKNRTIIPTGFADLDRQIGGFERGEVVVVAGRPSMGKTSLALDLQANTAACGFST